LRYGITDEMAWDVGLACGGTIEVYVESVAE
jgi:xanthine/CO dehydrogenase XdhC/CoxF family maturation factor